MIIYYLNLALIWAWPGPFVSISQPWEKSVSTLE